MLNLCELRHHCRTCLMKLETCHDNEDAKKYVQICRYPAVQQLIRLCLTADSGSLMPPHNADIDELFGHMPNLCGLCFEKWQDFVRFYQLALKSDEKLRSIVQKDTLVGGVNYDTLDKCEVEPNKVYLTEGPATSILCEIETYKAVSPFFHHSRSNTPSVGNPVERELNTPSPSPSPSPPPTPQSFNSSEEEKSQSDEEAKDDEDSLLITSNSKQLRKVRKRNIKHKIKRKCKESKNSLTDSAQHHSSSKKKLYRCEPCKKYFYETLTYEGHMKRVHEGIKRAFQCKDCDKAYSLYKNLVGHIAERHSAESQEVHKCEECNKTYKTKTTLKKHMKLQHSHKNEDNGGISQSKRIICDRCGFLAAHQDSLTQHIKNKHTETEEIRCELCPKVFKSQYNLKYHIQSFHTKVVPKPFKCNECAMAFTRRPLLNIHKRSHLNYSDRMKCDFEGCDVRFIKLSSKRRHMRLVHLKVKQHVCDICGEAFGIKATLRHHRYIHTGEKPYKCNVCGQGFRQATAMKTHRKTHFGKEASVALASVDNAAVAAHEPEKQRHCGRNFLRTMSL